MKHKKTLLCSLLLISCLILVTSMPVFAAELTEAEVQQAVDAQGKETVTGNVFIWFLCAIAFLKVSQKIDSFMASLGVNVGNTGGNMMAELLIAGRGLASSFRGHGGGSHSSSHSSSPGSAAVQSSFLSGGLAGAVGRQTERSAVNAATDIPKDQASEMHSISLPLKKAEILPITLSAILLKETMVKLAQSKVMELFLHFNPTWEFKMKIKRIIPIPMLRLAAAG